MLSEGDGSLLGVSFIRSDYYLMAGLMFSEQKDPPPGQLADCIAGAFE